MQNLLGTIDLDATIVERVTVAADGNPLYLEQMLQMLMDQGAIRHEGGRWIDHEGAVARRDSADHRRAPDGAPRSPRSIGANGRSSEAP